MAWNYQFNNLICDAPLAWALGIQDSASPTFEGITELHGTLLFYLTLISLGVAWIVGTSVYNSSLISHKYLTHGTILELVWTVAPAFILIAIAFPSFRLLYLLDEVVSPGLTLKVVGHQWYWSVEYSDYAITSNGDPITFDVYMIPDSDLDNGAPRLLAVDNNIVLPVGTHVRIVVTGADVIHDLACPSLGLKIDALPGRLNQGSTLIQRPGLYYGQCSEICGPLHGFIPLCIQGVSLEEFVVWLQRSASQ